MRMGYSENQSQWLTFQQAKKQLDDPLSSFVLFRCKRHMVLSPKFLGTINKGVRESLNSELRMYCKELSGVLIAYNNISILHSDGNIHDEGPFLHFDIEADFIVFRPTIGCSLKGKINKIGDDHVGCLLHSCVNASIPLPSELVKSGEFSGSDSSVVTTHVELEFEMTGITYHNQILTITGRLKPHSLDHIDLAELQSKQKELSNGQADSEDFQFLRLTSNTGGGARDHKPRVITDSGLVPMMDSNIEKKGKKRKKSEKREIRTDRLSGADSLAGGLSGADSLAGGLSGADSLADSPTKQSDADKERASKTPKKKIKKEVCSSDCSVVQNDLLQRKRVKTPKKKIKTEAFSSDSSVVQNDLSQREKVKTPKKKIKTEAFTSDHSIVKSGSMFCNSHIKQEES